ncbi:thioredoxin [Teladorsagia circumcincta]|uniref:Thioredoxin n=1 Tax=Teladorsagia circumcincta TaxID=45464 RepID=A0A2G9U452_TELCI|nr:thioredoxin [Teladorsagia circumcincta]
MLPDAVHSKNCVDVSEAGGCGWVWFDSPATMRLLLVVFAVVVLSTAANNDVPSGTPEQEEEVPPFEEDTTGEPENVDEANATGESAATDGKRKEEMITYRELFNLAQSGHHLMVVCVNVEGKASRKYLNNMPYINRELAKANVSLRIYGVGWGNPARMVRWERVCISDIVPDYGGVYVFRKGDKRQMSPMGAQDARVEEFLRTHTRPPLFRFPRDATLMTTFDELAFLFYVHNSEGLSENTHWVQTIANEHRGTIVVFLCDDEDLKVDAYKDIFELGRGSLPRVRLFHRDTLEVYRMEDNSNAKVINKKSVKAFISSYERGHLKVYQKSQKLPKNWNATLLKTLVGSNYYEVVKNEKNNTLVLLYTAEKSEPVPLFKEIAELYKNVENIVVAKMDVEHNAVPIIFPPVTKAPSIRLYEAGTTKETKFEGDAITLEAIMAFVEKTTGIVVKPKEESKETATKAEPKASDTEPKKREEL